MRECASTLYLGLITPFQSQNFKSTLISQKNVFLLFVVVVVVLLLNLLFRMKQHSGNLVAVTALLIA